MQIQESKEQHMVNKASSIVAAKRVKRTSNRNIWIVGSGNPTTPSKWYCVQWSEECESLLCNCPAYQFGMTNPCKHIISVAIKEIKESA